MDLAPSAFWSLTVREFWIKFDAFKRREDRQRSLMLELVLNTQHMKAAPHAAMSRNIQRLRRYPLKSWLKSP